MSIFGLLYDFMTAQSGIATGYGLDGRVVGFESRWRQDFSLLHVVQTGSGAHPASYSMDTGSSFPGA
jgi:hypothetical protein